MCCKVTCCDVDSKQISSSKRWAKTRLHLYIYIKKRSCPWVCLNPKYILTHCIALAGTINMLWTKKYSESKHGFTRQNNCPTTKKKPSIEGLDDASKRVNCITKNIFYFLTKSSLKETNRLQQWKPSISFPRGSHLGIPVRCSRAHRSFIQI